MKRSILAALTISSLTVSLYAKTESSDRIKVEANVDVERKMGYGANYRVLCIDGYKYISYREVFATGAGATIIQAQEVVDGKVVPAKCESEEK